MTLIRYNNEISRDILSLLEDHGDHAVRFSDLVEGLTHDEKMIFKNLFYMEENSLIQLMSSYPTGATFPTIHMIKLREKGRELIRDGKLLDSTFPVDGIADEINLIKVGEASLSDLCRAALAEEANLPDELIEAIRPIGESEKAKSVQLKEILKLL